MANQPLNPHLASFPRPLNDNGRGIHFILDSRQKYVEEYAPYLKRMKISWATVYGGDEAQCVRVAKYLKDNFGIFSNMRVYASGEKPKTPDFWQKFAELAIANGVPPYIQIFNEPEDGREGFDSPEHFASMWGQRAEAVVRGGGFPGLQVLSEEFIKPVCESMSPQVKAKLYFSLHNYGANHPPAYPYPNNTVLNDDTAVLRFFAFEEWFKKYLGLVPPMIGGEGGWLFKNHDDTSMDKVTIEKWIDWHYEMFEWFRKGVVSNGQPLPDYLFSSHPWLLWAGNWYSDSWINGLHSDQNSADADSTYGLYKSDLISKMENDAPYVRQFGGQVTPPQGENGASISGLLFPSVMWVGRDEQIGVVVRNTGTKRWTAGSYSLVPTSQNQVAWNSPILDVDVNPGEEYTFHFTIRGMSVGNFKLGFSMKEVYLFGETSAVEVSFRKEPTPPPTGNAYIDPRCSWVSYSQGSNYKVEAVYFYDSKPEDDPESEGRVEIIVNVVDSNGLPLWQVPVKQSWPDGSSTHITRNGIVAFDMSGDSSFDPKRGEKGVYQITVGDCVVSGFGLPLRQHVCYGIKIVRN